MQNVGHFLEALSCFSLLLNNPFKLLFSPIAWAVSLPLGKNISAFSQQAGTRPLHFSFWSSFPLLLPRHTSQFDVTLCINFLPKRMVLNLKISISCLVFQMAESYLSHISVLGQKEEEDGSHFKACITVAFLDLEHKHSNFWTWKRLPCYVRVKTVCTG